MHTVGLEFLSLRYENLLVLWFNFTYFRFGCKAVSERRHGVCKAMYKVLCLIPSYMDSGVSALKVELSVFHKGILCLLWYLCRELLGCKIPCCRYAAGWLYSSFPGGRQSMREKSSAATSLPVLVSAALGSFPGGLSFSYWPNLTLLALWELPRSQLKVVWL